MDGDGDGWIVGNPVTGFIVGADVVVGLSVGCGPETGDFEGSPVGAGLTHLSLRIPKHCSPGFVHGFTAEQVSAVQQLVSAIW